jgi:NHL repeat-containing protein
MVSRALVGVTAGLVAVLLLAFAAPLGATGGPIATGAGTHPSVTPAVNPPPNPFVTGMAASVALGAGNLSSTWGGIPPNASKFVPDPEFACAGSNGALWVPDYGGARVTEFLPPFTTGMNASVVLGQSTFSGYLPNTTATGIGTPGACATDAHGNLWVTDDGNSRVLEYLPPFTTGMAASLVVGQTGPTTGTAGTTPTTLSGPVGLSFDPQGNLWVADSSNNRVLEYLPPFSTGMAASIVLGQTSFLSATPGLSASNLSFPVDVHATAGVVWVADGGNDRVVGFAAPYASGEGATYLLGQSSFIGTGATGPGSFVDASTVTADSSGNLWVSDFLGSRVVEFRPPFTTFENPSVAIGQTSLTTTTTGLTATTLDFPLGAIVASNGALWVTDAGNSRVLEYVPNTYHVTFAAAGLPSSVNLTVTAGGTPFHGPGPNVTVTEENGSYLWSVAPIAGYTLSPISGNYSVNGANVVVSITVTKVTYPVTFNALGIPSGTTWSVTLGGVTHTSPNNGSISFTEANGTYAYTVANISGYNATPKLGSLHVSGAGMEIGIAFFGTSSSSSSSSSSPFSGTVALLLIVVAAVVGLVVGLLVGRRRKGGPTSAPAAQWAPPAPGPVPPPPPPGAGGPPPGAA